jgi:hypothetical protein
MKMKSIIKIELIILLAILIVNFGLDTMYYVKHEINYYDVSNRYGEIIDSRQFDTLPDVKLERQ